jgi:hypothetical protein
MRFVEGRRNGTITKPSIPYNDRRGRHTKRDRLARAKELEDAFERCIHPPRGCDCDVLTVPTVYSQGDIVCTGCGLVMEHHVPIPRIIYSVDTSAGTGISTAGWEYQDPRTWNSICFELDNNGYGGYKRANHFAELLKQATNSDPRIAPRIMRIIEEYLYRMLDHDAYRINEFISVADSAAIKSLLRFIDQDLVANPPTDPLPHTGNFVRKYAEHWLQIKINLFGIERYAIHGLPLLPTGTCHQLHDRYGYFARCFERLRQSKHPLFRHRNNIPQLNTVTLHLLAQIDPAYVNQYGWYFTPLATPKSRLYTEYRIYTIFKHMRVFGLEGDYVWNYCRIITQEDAELFASKPSLQRTLLLQAIQAKK